MSKAQRIRAQNAREKIAAQQAAARRAERRRRLAIVGGSVVAVLAIVIALVVVKLSQSSPSSSSNSGTTGVSLPATVTTDLTTVPAAALDTVGGGAARPAGAMKSISDSPLTSAGKPEMLYVGAEWCPYCAAMRWAMVVALSRFGSFTGEFRGVHSFSTDVYPNTATLTFYKGPTYSSRYLTFTSVENQSTSKGPLQSPTTQQNALWRKYTTGSYPFIDFGGKVVLTNPIYDPQVLHGLSWSQIAQDLHNPATPVAQGALGAANYLTAAICAMTGNKPASVCTSATISSLEPKI